MRDRRYYRRRTRDATGFIPNLSDAKGRRGYDAHVGERGETGG